jgi:glycerol-3-phosphate cytidylyltransferase-like family protein
MRRSATLGSDKAQEKILCENTSENGVSAHSNQMQFQSCKAFGYDMITYGPYKQVQRQYDIKKCSKNYGMKLIRLCW